MAPPTLPRALTVLLLLVLFAATARSQETAEPPASAPLPAADSQPAHSPISHPPTASAAADAPSPRKTAPVAAPSSDAPAADDDDQAYTKPPSLAPAPAPAPAAAADEHRGDDDQAHTKSPSPAPAADGRAYSKSPSPAPAAEQIKAASASATAGDQGVVDADAAARPHGEELDGGGKAGVALGAVAAAAVLGLGAFVWRKRRANIRRARYADYAARLELV